MKELTDAELDERTDIFLEELEMYADSSYWAERPEDTDVADVVRAAAKTLLKALILVGKEGAA